MKYLLTIILLTLSLTALATPAAIKNEDGTFKLSPESQKAMKIVFQDLKGSGPWTVPSSALVKIKFTTGVYRQFEGDITYVIVKVLENKGDYIVVDSKDLESGDEVAIVGTNFLRLTEADLNSDTVDSCSH